MPSRRAILWWTAGAALFVGAPAWMVFSAATAEPAGCGPETAEALMAHQRAALPGSELATERLDALLARFEGASALWRSQKGEDDQLRERVEMIRYGSWPSQEHRLSFEALKLVQPLVEELCATADPAEWLWPIEPDEDGSPIAWTSHLGGVRQLALMLASSMRAAAAREDWPAFERMARTSLSLGALVGRNPTLIGQLVAISIADLTFREIRHCAIEFAVPEDALERLVSVVCTTPVPTQPPRYWLGGERLYSIGFLGDFYDSSGQELTWKFDDLEGADSVPEWMHFSEDGPPEALRRVTNVRALFRPGRSAAERALNAAFADLIAWAELPPDRRPHSPPYSALARGHRIFDVFFGGGHHRAVWAASWGESFQRGTVALLRIEQFRAREGRLPQTLTEAMSVDEATDPLTGESFDYALEREAHHRPGFILRTARPDAMPRSGPDDLQEVLTLPRPPLSLDTFLLPGEEPAQDDDAPEDASP